MRVSRRVAFAISMSFAITLSAGAAAQQDAAGTGDRWARAEDNRVGLEFDLWPSHTETTFMTTTIDIDTVAMGWNLFGQIGVSDEVFIDFEIPWAAIIQTASANGQSQSGEGAAVGAITGGAHYADSPSDSISYWVGGTLSMPTQLLSDPDLESVVAGAAATAARGLMDLHRFAPEHMSLRMGGGIEARVGIFRYRGGLMMAHHIPFDGDYVFVLEQPNEFELRADMGFGGGLRFQEVFPLTENDLVQLSLEPFIGYEAPQSGFFGRFGVLMALDETLGFAFDQGKVTAFRFTGGGKW